MAPGDYELVSNLELRVGSHKATLIALPIARTDEMAKIGKNDSPQR
ncbi:hypothetical protein ACDY96_20110 [Rhizobium mongolense]|nr:hypothetical protein [Rhizobium sp. CC1099]WFU86485.1 hypothetical protein QA644_15355 [Rhizobium sp. CC1099]